MLVTSSTFKGKCPICGAANCSCGGPSTTGPGVTIADQKKGGKLVTVELRPGQGVKMHEDEARARGLWPPVKEKAQEPVKNKMRAPGRNKGVKA